ncbi:cytoskeleton-associated protein 2 isoform X4 [Hylobates moloch]|uniref:cytoskeleton-associated protein 2 isoform X4 n=2 Tax=Hylobates moloch TaxID=81572 RepID=UPI001363694E|nr:cytoskeleton-associated protein 2 isoform X4 [Hylobates moloch]
MSKPAVPQDLQLPPSQRAQSAFKEQRRQKLKEHLLRRKTLFAYKQENEMLSSSRGQRVVTSEDQVQEGTKVLKLKTKMADKENMKRPAESKNNTIVGKNCIPLKPSNELTNSTVVIDTHKPKDSNQTPHLLLTEDDPQSQHMTLSQAFHLKNNSKKKQMTTEKQKQDANMPRKPVLGSYRGQIVQSKINSFRKPLQVKDESSAATKKLSPTIPKATKPQPVNTSSVTVKSNRSSNMTVTTKFVSTTSQNTQLVRPPIRSHHSNTQDTVKQGISRTSANVTIRKGPREKELLQSKTALSSVKTSSSQGIIRNKTLSRCIASEAVARPASLSNDKLMEKSEPVDQRRHTAGKAAVDSRSAQPKETSEERKARLSEWKAGKGRVLKRPPNSVVTQHEPEGQNEKPVGSFWTTMAEEDEQRLFTEKVNNTFSECLNLINEGCPKEDILVTLNDLIKNIPDAKKLVKYWICLALIEPITSPIENIIAIYEKAILAGAQPIEEMRHTIVDILTMKSQEKANLGENMEKSCASKEEVKEVSIEDTGVDVDPEKLEMESKHHRNLLFQDCEKEQDNKTKDPTHDVKTPNTETRTSCLIKYNVSTTPYLQSVKKKVQFDETNSAFKELKFLTPVRRSRRLQEKTSKLPDMLKDHYPCVSSLEQLTELGGETDAFVCRPNAALCRVYYEADTTEEK